ncbi:MAG: phenylalanine 4-monooxygenase [Steroidobacteraceae bacterium]|nr:phenylalanine 4-monooxygenase [Steroidobacteraceae bacterium]
MQAPLAPTARPVQLRGDYEHARDDYTVEQDCAAYTPEEHAVWRDLYRRQVGLVERYAAPEFLAGVRALGVAADRIPSLAETSSRLGERTGWRLVAVPGLIPEAHFFAHLAARRFPVTVWIRTREELDYLVEPDLFHDFFGHVPLLANPVFADFLQAYGRRGPEAERLGGLKMLARLYWYMVEFGLIRTPAGLRAYGAGMLSSAGETVYCIEDPRPSRLAFDLERVMRTDYLIDDYQRTYFVVDGYEQLFEAVLTTDFAPLYARYAASPGFAPGAVLPGDRLVDPEPRRS